MGSLVLDNQDASGLMYRRNRYYDPHAGRFTQEDPIGLAGGVNAYGFAAGDPVSYGDPYGLRADTVKLNGETEELRGEARRIWNELGERARAAVKTGNWNARASGRELLRMMNRAERSSRVYSIEAIDLNADGGGNEAPDPSNPNRHLIQIDPDGAPGQKASPWIILAHELGGAMQPRWMPHAVGSLQAENLARNVVGCWPRWGHGTDTYADCFQ